MLNTPTDVCQISAPGGSTKVDTLGIYTDLIINTYYLVLPFVNGENRNVFFYFLSMVQICYLCKFLTYMLNIFHRLLNSPQQVQAKKFSK